ncbi:MAG: MBL fold metallo-hydrolase, partial [Deltaproteobacteria bacterium]
MSEAIPGYTPPPPKPPRDAAVVLLWRDGPSGRELFWLQRGARLAFGGGMYAYPGGKLDPTDFSVPVQGATGEGAALVTCAARELFEEAGILAARGAGALSAEARAGLRAKLLSGELPFERLLRENGLSLAAQDYAEAGRWVTPPFLPGGFDARFFWVELPADQAPEVLPGECASGEFIAPKAALERWRAGRALMHPPTLNALEALLERTIPETLERLRHPPFVNDLVAERLEFQEGIVLVPLRTETLPPATHTNCIVLGLRETVIVDPGTDDPEELGKLRALVQALGSEGRRPVAVVVTHHHRDHVTGAR